MAITLNVFSLILHVSYRSYSLDIFIFSLITYKALTTYLEKTGYRDKTEYVYDETNNKHYMAEYQKSHVNVT